MTRYPVTARIQYVRTSRLVMAALGAGLILCAPRGYSEEEGAEQENVVQGFTEPSAAIEVAAPEPGIIASVVVSEGDNVTNGQYLASLDSGILRAALKISRVRLESTGRAESLRAESEAARRKLDQLLAIVEQGAVTAEEVERARVHRAIAEANLKAEHEEKEAQALECRLISSRIERKSLRSPIDGIVTEVFREVGESVKTGDDAVVSVVRLDPLRLTFYVSPLRANSLEIDQVVSVDFVASGLKGTAKIESISPVAEPRSGTVRVRAAIRNGHGKYRSGERCSVGFP